MLSFAWFNLSQNTSRLRSTKNNLSEQVIILQQLYPYYLIHSVQFRLKYKLTTRIDQFIQRIVDFGVSLSFLQRLLAASAVKTVFFWDFFFIAETMKDNIKKRLETDGYVIIEDFLSEKEVELLKEEANSLIKSMPEQSTRTIFSTSDSENQQNKDTYFLDSANKISYFYETGALDVTGNLLVDPKVSLNKIGHALHDLNPVFRKVSLSEKVKECAFQLGFQDPAIAQSMYIFKNPGIGSEVVPHQDAWYLYTEPMSVVGFWFALEDATIENGCLWFSKGSHKSGVHRRYIRNPDKNSPEFLIYTAPAPFYQTSHFNSTPVPKGTLVLIHGQVVHFSEPNKSEKSRHAYTFHVIEQKNTTYSEENWLQPSSEGFLSLYRN